MTNTKLNLFGINILAILFAIGITAPAMAANVVQRGRVSASTNSAPGARGAATRPAITPNVTTTEPVSEPEPTPEIIADVSSQFTVGTQQSVTDTNNSLGDAIARQRATLDAQSAVANVATMTSKQNNAKNACDTGLRACMAEKCGADFADCRTDTDTAWGIKMDGCRAKLKCTAAEYSAFAPELKADRDMASSMETYTRILECGNSYNKCITDQCGKTYSKCLGKSAMDSAIAACKTTAQQCIEYDSGLAARTGEVIATLRDGAEKKIATDEKRLYELRDQMRAICKNMGASLDERSMNCVYSVEFYADKDGEQTLFASKKAYAGATFDCTPNWFGIDITTFKENAYRLTRGQVGASSAMMGAGVGTAAGLITSGALNRAVETQKAQKEVKKAEKELNGGKTNKQLEREEKRNDRKEAKEEKKEERQANREERQETRATNKAARQAERNNKNNKENSSSSQGEGAEVTLNKENSKSVFDTAKPSNQESMFTSTNTKSINNVTAAKGTPTNNSPKPTIKSVPSSNTSSGSASTSSGSNSSSGGNGGGSSSSAKK